MSKDARAKLRRVERQVPSPAGPCVTHTAGCVRQIFITEQFGVLFESRLKKRLHPMPRLHDAASVRLQSADKRFLAHLVFCPVNQLGCNRWSDSAVTQARGLATMITVLGQDGYGLETC